MKKFIIIGIFATLIIMSLSLFGKFASTKKALVSYEKQIVALNKQMENVHSKTFKTIKGIAKVNDKYSSDLQSLVKSYVEGRQTSKEAIFTMTQEAIPNINTSTYDKLIQALETGYKEFADSQDRKIDLIAKYETYLEEGIIRPMFISSLDYPKINLEELGKVISAQESKDTMETKIDEGVDF